MQERDAYSAFHLGDALGLLGQDLGILRFENSAEKGL